MAHFIGVIDPSAERRSRFSSAAREILSSSYASAPQAFERDSLTMIAWQESWEPFVHVATHAGVSFTWGHAMAPGRTTTDPVDLFHAWEKVPERVPAPLEGIHAALLYRADGSWVAGADLFGLMPLYYFAGNGFTLIGSTPELFRAHPLFEAKIDAAGLAGVLLTNGLVAGRSLLRGIKRLAPSHLLHARGDGLPRELAQYQPEYSDANFGSSFEANYARMEGALDDCWARHVDPSKHYALLLSGGLDSRLVGGLLKEKGVSFHAVTFGERRDIEVMCATAVARELGVKHTIVPVRMADYVRHADVECRWKHLANGFSNLLFHEQIPDADSCDGGMLSGYVMEAVTGFDNLKWAGPDEKNLSFDNYLTKVCEWALPVESVERLLDGPLERTAVEEAVTSLAGDYHRSGDLEFRKAWLCGLHYRSRFHTTAVLGIQAHWPWPVVPYIDTQMLAVMGTMPVEHVFKRRMQYHMLETRFPRLARLPLDRAGYRMKPFVPRYGKWLDRLAYKPRELFYRHTDRVLSRRLYDRTLDFESPGWRAVRAVAESYRASAQRFLNPDALAEVLPRPEQNIDSPDGTISKSGRRLLTGFLLWSALYPEIV